VAHLTQDHAKGNGKGKDKGKGKGWKTKQKTAGIRRDAQLSALTQMIRVLAGDSMRLATKCKVLEDVLAKKCGVTMEDFDASTASVMAAMKPVDQTDTPANQSTAPADAVEQAQAPVVPGVMDTPVATGDALAAA